MIDSTKLDAGDSFVRLRNRVFEGRGNRICRKDAASTSSESFGREFGAGVENDRSRV